MASQVLSGSSNVTYTNNTGGNVRLIINYMAGSGPNSSLNITWAGVSASATSIIAIGKNIAYTARKFNDAIITNNMASLVNTQFDPVYNQALPTEIMLSNSQTFAATCGAYNLVVIPESG